MDLLEMNSGRALRRSDLEKNRYVLIKQGFGRRTEPGKPNQYLTFSPQGMANIETEKRP